MSTGFWIAFAALLIAGAVLKDPMLKIIGFLLLSGYAIVLICALIAVFAKKEKK